MGWSAEHQNLDSKITVEWDTEENAETTEVGTEWKHHSAVEKTGREE
jgi:hypothetical protein